MTNKEKGGNHTYYPNFIAPQSNAVGMDITHGLTGWMNPELLDLGNRGSIVRSMDKFSKEINKGGINNLVTSYAKNSSIPSESYNFIVSKPLKSGFHSNLDRYTGYFAVDGDFAFALGAQQKNEDDYAWLALVSMLTASGQSSFPIINQIQADYHYFSEGRKKREFANVCLENLRWEFVLVSLIVDWAASCSIPKVHILPGRNTAYAGTKALPLERAKMRYDVTAERYGFKKQENGLYTLDIQYPVVYPNT